MPGESKKRLAKRRLVKGAQLTRVQLVAFGAQQLYSPNADLQMFGDRPFIKRFA